MIGYPELEGDEARRAIWLYDVPLEATHHLRGALNNSKVDYREVLDNYELPIIASVLKLYLLELPGLCTIIMVNLNVSLTPLAQIPWFLLKSTILSRPYIRPPLTKQRKKDASRFCKAHSGNFVLTT